MNHISKYSAVVAFLGVLAFAGPSMVSAYGGGAFIGGVTVVTPTPTVSVQPTETPEVLGASTSLPDTGLSLRDALILTLSASLFIAGMATTASSLKK